MPSAEYTAESAEPCTCNAMAHQLGARICMAHGIGVHECLQDAIFTRHVAVPGENPRGASQNVLCGHRIELADHGEYLYEVAVPTCWSCVERVRNHSIAGLMGSIPHLWFRGLDEANHVRAMDVMNAPLCGYSENAEDQDLAEDNRTCRRCLRAAVAAASTRRVRRARLSTARTPWDGPTLLSAGIVHVQVSTGGAACGLRGAARGAGTITCPRCVTWANNLYEIDGATATQRMVPAGLVWHVTLGGHPQPICGAKVLPSGWENRYLLENGTCQECIRIFSEVRDPRLEVAMDALVQAEEGFLSVFGWEKVSGDPPRWKKGSSRSSTREAVAQQRAEYQAPKGRSREAPLDRFTRLSEED